jgi:hypothetical protein
VLTVVVCQCNREKTDLHDIELEDSTRSRSSWPASITSKRKRRWKKARKRKARDSVVTINEIDLESEEIGEESFEEDTTLVGMDVGTKGVSGSERCDNDISKVSGS